MNATLTRNSDTDAGTFGLLEMEDGTVYRTGELPWRDNRHQVSCIPLGTYRCAIYHSPSHGDVYEVQNVPDRSNIEIHPANWFGDKALGFRADMLGCIGLGMDIGSLSGQVALIDSKKAVDDFMRRQFLQPFELTIVGAVR